VPHWIAFHNYCSVLATSIAFCALLSAFSVEVVYFTYSLQRRPIVSPDNDIVTLSIGNIKNNWKSKNIGKIAV